jgi:hypothetical protein
MEDFCENGVETSGSIWADLLTSWNTVDSSKKNVELVSKSDSLLVGYFVIVT